MFEELIEKAEAVLKPRRLSSTAEASSVAAAILTKEGHIYTGVCIDTACSMGFCAEHSAAAAMITAGESEIVKMVAINKRGNILPPCGRCREFISQLNDANIEAEVLINRQRAVKLIDLLPYDWRQSKMSEVE
ncbi:MULTISPECIES: cytidine deaminase family protein [Turicibacter]|mgnify:CR=1|jgi:cytidine and deoxycytidylate deaminase zinc-binding region|uniref:cytidine deaminase family protein n=1 Tax=Turicibacter TaxID=191303 RepID=UPI0001FDB392|nr:MULTISPECIES: cytidine deaminase [Turicibacter]EGC91354.1 cytidine and deoxycytidylate deaminase zinc-binding region [Turicibacter sp. HGF1]MBP3903279.1 cytidine deaminase [Turicibacter sp.]MCU7192438.1 cytidine deaminase [Turicibacter sanguinis]MCU7197464.1 cytidine deaminase [Turicibacter sanguinis]MCU7200844.1 cytidine deaminase [Turicibacter sanguinis]